MNKIMKRLTAQIMAVAMTFQMVGQYGEPVFTQKVYAQQEYSGDVQTEQTDTADETDESDLITVERPETAEISAEVSSSGEDLVVNKNYTLSEDTEVNSLTVSGGTLDLNGHTLIVHGSVIHNGTGNIKISGGELICSEYTDEAGYSYQSHNIIMTDPNDRIAVSGNMYVNKAFSSDKITAGVIEAGGDITVDGSMQTSGDSVLRLNGNAAQKIDLGTSDKTYIKTVDVQNTSAEGVYADSVYAVGNTLGNTEKIHFLNDGHIGENLSDDITFEGNYTLVAGVLDLNGHKMTVKGDLIQSGGEIKVNNGELVVEGDYRIQTVKNEGDDRICSYSRGILAMENADDKVAVGGSFVTASSQSHKDRLKAGTLEIGKDFEQICVSAKDNFICSGEHKVIFKNASGHQIKFDENSETASHFADLAFEAGSVSSVISNVYVSGVLEGSDCTVDGQVYLIDNAHTEGIYSGDIVLSKAISLSGDIRTVGNLYIKASTDIKGHTVSADSIFAENYVYINKGELISRNDLTVSEGNASVDMTYLEDTIRAGGDFIFGARSSAFKAGKLYVEGNVKINSSAFCPAEEHETVLCGNSRQTVEINDPSSYFGTLHVTNKSSDGVEFLTAVDYIKLIIDDGCKVKHTGGGESGSVLLADKTVNGDLMLAAGTLDLNGHKLTVKGDLIQSGGEIKINNGELIIEGDYRIQNRTGEEGSYAYSYSTGKLVMDSADDKLTVKGSFITQSNASHSGLLTDGIMTIGKDLKQITAGSKASFAPSGDHTVVFDGDKNHDISFGSAGESSSHLNNVIFEKGSVNTFSTAVYASGTVKGADCDITGKLNLTSASVISGSYSGDVVFPERYILKEDADILGNIETKVNGFDVNGKKLTVGGNASLRTFDVSGGSVDIKGKVTLYGILNINKGDFKCGSMKIEFFYGSLSMLDPDDVLEIRGDLEHNGQQDQKTLKDGRLYIGGDLDLYAGNFRPETAHQTIFNGTGLQKVTVHNSTAKLGTVRISNNSDDGVKFLSAVEISDLIVDEGCKVELLGDGKAGEKLTRDITVDGDYVLAMGTLDLNGHKMTVKGDFIQMSGTVKINNGELVVEGDYRIQSRSEKNGSYSYTSSSGSLIMENAEDKVAVNGSFITDSVKNHNGLLSDGTMYIGKDFKQLSTGGGYYNFKATGGHRVVFEKNSKHNISFSRSNIESVFNHLTFEEGSEITLTNVCVAGEFDGQDCIVTGAVELLDGSKVIGAYCGDIVFNRSYKLTGDIEAFGNISVNDKLDIGGHRLTIGKDLNVSSASYACVDINGGTVTVKGNANVSKQIRLDKGKLICENDLIVSRIFGYIVMEYPEDEIRVNGNFEIYDDYAWSSFKNGKLYISGNTVLGSNGFNAAKEHETILCGRNKQTVKVTASNAKFGTLHISNRSSEGVELLTSIVYDELIIDDGCKIGISGEGEVGSKLTSDKTVNGDYLLAMGTLDLNGHKLTVKGDFIQSGGEVDLNGGELLVEGDYRIQTRSGKAGSYSYSYSTGTLVMNGSDDKLTVNGSFITQSTKSHSGLLTNGKMYVSGDLRQVTYDAEDNFAASGNHKVILCGDASQTVRFSDPGKSHFADVTFNKNGTVFESDVYASGKVSDKYSSVTSGKYLHISDPDQLAENSYAGELSIDSDGTVRLTRDYTFKSLNFKSIDLDGHTIRTQDLTVNGQLYADGGSLEVRNDLTFSENASLKMDSSDDSIYVGGNFIYDSGKNSYMSAGTLEVRGDFRQLRESVFSCSGTHITRLTGKGASNGRVYIQTVRMYNNSLTFNELVITKPRTQYVVKDQKDRTVSLEDICNSLTEDIHDTQPPEKVGGLSASEVTSTSAKLVWEASSDDDIVIGYEIFRNGEKIVTTGRTEYTDVSLSPDTEYTYQVFAFDAERNYSEGSDKLKIHTISDTEPPETPRAVSVKAATGSSVTLCWNPSSDNTFVAGYIVYRDNDEIARTVNCEYKDTGLENGTDHSYMIKAYDRAGNLSDFSEKVIGRAVIPEIISLEPSDNTRLGGKSQKIKITYRRTGSADSSYLVISQRAADEEDFTVISNGKIRGKAIGAESMSAEYDWDTDGLDGIYELKAELYDEDDNTDTAVNTYHISSSGPKAPSGLAVVSDNGTVELTWTKSASADCTGYIIYRAAADSGKFEKIAEINDKNTVRYVDRQVVSGVTYTYYLKGTDSFGNKGSASETVSVTADEDLSAPKIISITSEKPRLNADAKITVTAEDNISVDRIRLEYRKSTDEEYTLIDEVQAENGSAVFTWDTSALRDGMYTVRAVAFDGNSNASEDTETSVKDMTVDNSGIFKIVLDTENCTAYENAVVLRWVQPVNSDLGYYVVEQKQQDGSFKRAAESVSSCGTQITGLAAGKEYTFRVIGYDDIGNRGIPSDEITLKTQADTVIPYIISFGSGENAFSSEIPLEVKAGDNNGVASVRFAYSYNEDMSNASDLPEQFAQKAQKESTFNYSFDVSALREGKVYVSAQAVDTAGNVSEKIIAEYTVDRTAPENINDLVAQTSDGNIHLVWTAADDDIEKFIIYRSAGESGKYSKLTECSTKDHYDTTAEIGEVYSYKIAAVDAAGNKSAYSNETVGQLTEDNIRPEVIGFTKESGTTLHADPKLELVARDNHALSYASVSFRPKTSVNGVWYEIAREELDSNYSSMKFTWHTDGLSSGTYEFRAFCTDRMGNMSDEYIAEFILDEEAPDAPVIDLMQYDFRIRLEWNPSEAEDIDHYSLYRKGPDDEDFRRVTRTSECFFDDNAVVPDVDYSYKVRAYDSCGNYSESRTVSGYAYANDSISPVIDLPDEIYGIAGEELELDGSAITDNVRVRNVKWALGDGNEIFGFYQTYTYESAGEYTLTVTAVDTSNNSAEKTVSVHIYNPSEYGYVDVYVTDRQNVPLANSYIYTYTGDISGVHSMRTNSGGRLRLCSRIGTNKVAAFKNSYMPLEKTIEINNIGSNGTEHFVLSKGDIVSGHIDVHRMSLEEMADAGIDFGNSSNYHIFKFKVTLVFEQQPIPTVYEVFYNVNENSLWGPGFRREDHEYRFSARPDNHGKSRPRVGFGVLEREDEEESETEEEEPILAYIRFEQSISFMKDMFLVSLGVINNASQEYEITASSAAISLPGGLSLTGNKAAVQDMEDIRGGEHRSVNWAVRGDKKGDYNIEAGFTGTLMPFGAPVHATFITEDPFTVGAGEGLVIHVYPEKCAYIGEEYYVQLAVVNEGEDTFYNLTTDFGPVINPSTKQEITVTDANGHTETYPYYSANFEVENAEECSYLPVLSGGDEINVKVFAPGDVIRGTYHERFTAPGDPDKVYYTLKEHLIEQFNDDTNVKVVIEPIPSHIIKHNVVQKVVDVGWADPVDMTTGAFTDQVPVISAPGESGLTLNLNYNSLDVPKSREPEANEQFYYSHKGQLGYGWSHDFETYLDVRDTVINVHWNPTCFSSFIDERSAVRNVYGEIVNNSIIVHSPNDSGVKNYVCSSAGMSDYFMSRDENNIYTLELPSGQKYVFDSEGKLTNIIQANGKSSTITHSGNTTTITEDNTGAMLVLNYNSDGLLTSAGDGHGRMAYLTYNNDLLTSIINAEGDAVTYIYDDRDRLISAAFYGCAPYVVNTYDDENRVIAQDDADSNTPLSYFSYSTTENNEFVTVGTDRNGNTVKYVSDGVGHLLSVTDQNGHTVKYGYDIKGNMLTETDAEGHTTIYTYNENNDMVKIRDASGYVTSMTYDDKGNLLSVIGPDGEVASTYTYNGRNLLVTQTEASSARKSYTYDHNGQIASETIHGLGTKNYGYTNGMITSVTDYEGNISENSYDEYGNLRSQTDREGHSTVYGYDMLGRVVSVTTEDGTESYTYDQMGNKVSVTDVMGSTTTYCYNANNWLISQTDSDGTVSYFYDNEGHLTSRINADGTSVSYIVDAKGNVLSETNEKGEVTEYTYDADDRVVSTRIVGGDNDHTETNEYYPNGKIKKTVFADGTSISYYYDKQWQLIKTVDELGNSVTNTYGAHGVLESTTDEEGNTVTYSYDKYGRMTSSTDANGNITTYDKYDLNGLCTQKTLPNGQIIKIMYDNEGRVIQTTLAAADDGGEDISAYYEYDAAGRVTKYTDEEGNVSYSSYDPAGNIIKATDAEGNTITSEYDSMNRMTLVTNALGVDTAFAYDSMGSLVSTTANAATAREQITSNSYDVLGRLISTTDAENGTAKYNYDRFGNIISVTDPNGGVNSYSYDSMGRMTASENAIGSKKTYTYDDVGRLASQSNARGEKTTYEYYKNGWIKSFTDELGTVSYTYDGNGNVLTVTDENGTITREYDCMDHVTKYTDFRGNTIKYSYDQIGNLVSLTYPGGKIVRYSYYKNGKLKTVTDWDGRLTEFEYDGNGRLVKTVRPEGSVEERTYDAVGRLVTIDDKNGDEPVSQTVYSYDESGNVTNITASEGTSMEGLESAEMKYNAANQLIEYNGENVKYDADGNMIHGPLNGRMTDFEYDCRNRLISAGGISYAYDAENNRISQTENNVTTNYVIDTVSNALNRILIMDKGGEKTYFVYGTGLLAQKCGREYLTYHFNNIGSTTAITDESGAVVERFEYGPYGELTNKHDSAIIFLYTGEYGVVTDSSGLYYMRARYYDPAIKRFINQDVLTGSITDSPTLNRYAYVNGNPISLSDPFGLSPILNWLGDINGHRVLDLLGMIPGAGFVFDIANAIWYANEGNTKEALLSLASALPGAGDAIGAMSKGSKMLCMLNKTFHVVGNTANLYYSAKNFVSAAKSIGASIENGDGVSFGQVFNLAVSGMGMYSSATGLQTSLETSYCFIAGTLVTTADGLRPIEEIEVGDLVLSEDETTGEVAYKCVTKTFVNETTELIHIHVGGETISATPAHPFYVDGFGWTLAGNLRAGDVLVLSNGERVVVEWVQHEIIEAPVLVYNFEVEDFHTYFVGESGILVHNECKNAWNQYQQDHKHDLNPETGKKYTRSELAAKYNAEKPAKVSSAGDSVHGNSKSSMRPQHGYEIYDKKEGGVVKTGISGSVLNQDGSSKRANSQVNKWNAEVGEDRYVANVVINNIPGREAALRWEYENAQRLFAEGQPMNRHQLPKRRV